jgi:hypothetical protein
MPPAVDGEADGASDIHPLKEWRLAGDLAGGDEHVSAEDQRRAGPAGDFDRNLDRGQAASLRST